MAESKSLFLNHCGYEGLKTFQMGRLIYDITVGFCTPRGQGNSAPPAFSSLGDLSVSAV